MKSFGKKVGPVLCSFVLAMGCGCIGSKVHFEDIPVAKVDMTRGRTVEGCTSGFQLLCLIPIGINGRQESAYWKLRRAAGNDFVTDIGVEESWTWAYIGTIHKTRLIGTAYPEKLSAIAPVPSVMVEAPSLSKKLSELKQLHDSHMLSDTEYDAARARAIEQFK